MSSQNIILWGFAAALALLLLLALGLAFLLVRRWRSQAQTRLKANRSLLRGLQNERQQILAVQAQYLPADPAPYGAQAAILADQLGELDLQVMQAEKRHVQLQERLHRNNASPWRTLFSAPLSWQQLNQEAQRARGELENTQRTLAQAQDAAHKLGRLSLETASRAQEAARLDNQLKELLGQLQGFNLHGAAFETALGQQVRLHSRLGEIPALYTAGDEVTILEKADKTTTAQVHAIAEETMPQLEMLLQQCQDWEQQRLSAFESAQVLQAQLAQLRSTLAQSPQAMDVTEQQGRMVHIDEIALNLQQTVSRLEMESAFVVSQEAGRLTDILREMDVQLHQAQEQLPQLEANLASLAQLLDEASTLIGELAAHPAHPIQWVSSSAELAALNRQANSLGGVRKRRTPEQVLADLGSSAALIDGATSLASHLHQIKKGHDELLRLLARPELRALPAWLASANQTAQRAAQYAVENYARQDMAGSLEEDLKLVEAESQRLLQASRPAPIPEDQLNQELEDWLLLLDGVQRLQRRAENIQDRVGQLQQDEKRALNQLEKLSAVLVQIAYVVRSNSSLAQVCGAEVDRLQENAAALQESLALHGKDTVDRKVKAVQALAGRSESAANQWLGQLNLALSREIEALSANLTALQEIAPLDEGVVEEARRRLSANQGYSIEAKTRLDLKLEQVPAELKRRSDFYQSCLAASKALQDTAQPLIAAHQGALRARRAAQQALAESGEWLRQGGGWPPSSLTLDAESAELNALEQRWHALQQAPNRALTLVGELAGLGGEYQALSARLQVGVEQALHERVQVVEMEDDLQELEQSWQEQLRAYQDQPVVSREIRALLDEIAQGTAEIRRQAQRKNASYSGTLQALKALQRKARFYQVALDEDHAIDASGNVKRRM